MNTKPNRYALAETILRKVADYGQVRRQEGRATTANEARKLDQLANDILADIAIMVVTQDTVPAGFGDMLAAAGLAVTR